MAFWNADCKKLSDQLWIPTTTINYVPVERANFKCQNNKISFNYFSDDVTINRKIKFQEIPVVDHSEEKAKLDKQLFGKELKRFCREIDKKYKCDARGEKKYWTNILEWLTK